jgi:hypothetical protein
VILGDPEFAILPWGYSRAAQANLTTVKSFEQLP